MRKCLFLVLLVLSLVGAGPLAGGRFVKVFFPDGSEVMAELAVTDAERQRGLMYRENLREDQAMLFVFEAEGIYAFWMKNMNFAIDILWLDKDKRIVHMEPEVPPCRQEPCPSYVPHQAAQYVLELRSGWGKRHGLQLYDRVEFILPPGIL